MITLSVSLNLPDVEDALRRFNLEPGGLVQKVVDKAVIDWSIPYTPFETGILANSPYTATDIGSGRVVYNTPYARYLYYGEVYGPNIPVYEDDTGTPTRYFSPPGQKKHPTGRELQFKTDINPLAGSFWVRRMAADHMADIVKEAYRAAGIK